MEKENQYLTQDYILVFTLKKENTIKKRRKEGKPAIDSGLVEAGYSGGRSEVS